MSKYLNVNNTAAELGVTVTSIYKLIKDKQLEPVNQSTFKGDGGYMFRVEDIERIKPLYIRTDLTSSEAAERIGRSTTFIHKLIRDQDIPFYEGVLRGKKTYFIKEADLERYTTDNPNSGKYDTLYDKAKGVFLFQPFRKEGRLARVVQMKRVNRRKLEIELQVGATESMSYEQAIRDGWTPAITISNKKNITSYGYAVFEFPIPSTLDSMIYSIIEELFRQVGPSNMKIKRNDKLIVEVKKSELLNILPTTHPDMIDKLKLFIKSGEIITKYNGTLIDTGLSPVTVYLPEAYKQKMQSLSELENKSVQEWIQDTLSKILEE
ncbi:MAG: helix-turn-helix domain-containing protein [Candidatus Pristimantibacillus sp.]